eukprot:5415527-Alexandrium_andersonii.AAC.1
MALLDVRMAVRRQAPLQRERAALKTAEKVRGRREGRIGVGKLQVEPLHRRGNGVGALAALGAA